MKNYINPEGIETPIEICSQTTQNWLCKLKYEYQDVWYDMFFDEHECSDMVKDRNSFLTRMKDLKPYIVEFEENNAIKPKIYLFDYAARNDDC